MTETKISIFKGKDIRKVIYKNQWWFVIEDVVLALIDSHDPKQYIQRMKQRDPELAKGYVQLVRTLPITTAGGSQKMICANTKSIFRIVQSIPSPKAEPFKRWLAKVGYERIQEIEDPELATKRTRKLYKLKRGFQRKLSQKARKPKTVKISLILLNFESLAWCQFQKNCAIGSHGYLSLQHSFRRGHFCLSCSSAHGYLPQQKILT